MAKEGSTMCGRRRQADGGNLYKTRACADVWKGTRQLVYELTVLSFSLSFSLSLSLPLSRAVLFVLRLIRSCLLRSIRFRPRVPFHSDFASVPLGLVLVFRSIRILPPSHSVLAFVFRFTRI